MIQHDDGSDDALDCAVGGSVSAMGALEEAVLDLLDGQSFSLLEMEELSCMIDRELVTDGLTLETIDELFLDDSCSDEAGSKDGEDNVRVCHGDFQNSILMAHHCECGGGAEDEMYYRYLQQRLLATDTTSGDEQRHGLGKQLLHLRSLHKHTLQRTSAACTKYNPFDVVWKQALG